MSVRTRLIVGFVIATLMPLGITVAVSVSLLKRSLSLASTRDLDELSRALEKTGRELYQRTRESLKQDAEAGKIQPIRYLAGESSQWPSQVHDFAATDQPERAVLTGSGGDRMEYLVRHGRDVWLYEASLHGVALSAVAEQYAHARAAIARADGRNLRRGYIYTLIVLAAALWVLAFSGVILWATRLTRPIRRLTQALSEVASGRLDQRVDISRYDEIGVAIDTFNRMTEELRHSRDRLVYMARLESWQALARKMAHEVKNSLTPIRLTIEEVAARDDGRDNGFLRQASQIVVDEVTALERRVRAFADFSSEPPVRPTELDLNSLLQERVSFLKTSHPEIVYNVRLSEDDPRAVADEDLVKGMLTNLLENAAQAAQPGGVVLGVTNSVNGHVSIEVHDSGPGLNASVRNSLFQPTISFKRGGMGLGLSIARRSAVLSGGDIELVDGELGGAGFRVLLPRA
jgi:two-component system, NtrC family, nitrogen regulation sensor histidine kinase NtrY